MGMLDGRTVAVTGAGRGIGREIALACAAAGAHVVVNDIGVQVDGSPETGAGGVADEVVGEIRAAGGTAVAVTDSVTTMAGGQAVVDAALSNWGALDGVVCAAGIVRERMLFNMTEDEWDGVLDTHLKGTFTVFRAAARVMRAQRAGRLVGFASGNFAGSLPQPNYSAAKGGIVSLVRSAALGMHRYGVTANAIAPIARTRMSAHSTAIVENGEPGDVAPLAVYLLSQASAQVTGQVYTAVGGKIAVWNQPREVRAMYTDGRWTAEEIGRRLPGTVGQERMPGLDSLPPAPAPTASL
jgi:NAD(P)-dependent dehydrogenase (short-subunit alcohol dehydrogenase family)